MVCTPEGRRTTANLLLNFGHGTRNPSSVLAIMMNLDFPIDQVRECCFRSCQAAASADLRNMTDDAVGVARLAAEAAGAAPLPFLRPRLPKVVA